MRSFMSVLFEFISGYLLLVFIYRECALGNIYTFIIQLIMRQLLQACVTKIVL